MSLRAALVQLRAAYRFAEENLAHLPPEGSAGCFLNHTAGHCTPTSPICRVCKALVAAEGVTQKIEVIDQLLETKGALE